MHLRREEESRNMARYYVMEISSNLFGETCLARTWGRIGTKGQTKIHLFEREEEAQQLLVELAERKQARGYTPL
ncbi:MAG: WGR domain-containing protein [Rhizobiaceae bacterium]|nr:WGR domain-containing protein [Rhizobiaceae bacterium]MCZ8353068.1 WGR domain-containing protein [Rhizobium sp.]